MKASFGIEWGAFFGEGERVHIRFFERGGCWGGGYIRFFGNGGYWFRPYGGSLWKSPKVTIRALAPPLGASPRLGMPSLRRGLTGRLRSKSKSKARAKPEQSQSKARAKPEQKQNEVYLTYGDI
ncbi:hypothetical protein [Pseudomonas sp.]|uniref:hypothetical protein n=1 Tax=Pseudomonas sp. TaxID=306 RepID=UPI003FD861CE